MSFAPGPPLTDSAVRVLLGSGELDREVAIEALRLDARCSWSTATPARRGRLA